MSVLSQRHSIIFNRGISSPGNGKEVVEGPNFIDKLYMYQLMSTVQLPGSKTFDSNILMHSCTPKKDVSLAKEFQKHMSKNGKILTVVQISIYVPQHYSSCQFYPNVTQLYLIGV